MGKTARVPAALLAVALYVASLALPAFRSPLRRSRVVYSGYDAFLVGWRAWVGLDPLDWDGERVILCAGWVANPATWVAVVCLAGGSRQLAAGFAGVALAGQLPVGWRCWAIVAGYPGFWCWVAAPVWLVAAAWAGRLIPRRPVEPPPAPADPTPSGVGEKWGPHRWPQGSGVKYRPPEVRPGGDG